MTASGNHRTVLRRAALGCVATVTLALACACGPGQTGGSDSAKGAPSASTAANGPTDGGTSPGAGATTPGATASSGPAASSEAPDGTTPDGTTPGATTPSGKPGGKPAPGPTGRPSPGHNAGTGSSTPTPPGSPAPATTAAAPPPAPDAPAASIAYGTATGGRTVALTFDDGPGPATPKILDLLAQYHAKATFCEIGPQAAADPAIVQRILAEGHRLCDHTVHHPQPMHTLSHDKQVYEINGAKDMIEKAGGPGTRISWFRAPGGDFSAENRQIAVQSGLRPLGWTVDTLDWSRPGVPAILANVHKELRPGGIILMHDGGGDRSQSVAALAQLLPWLVQQGYTFDFPAS
ncbi:polysaccharide deacetylase family protein [Kitasatospora viridis]|uniref:Peptidoglycan/xylan/chitin deacetylase (PgdA/CDA1 family) n=1 Tax=Kitasatospora viridis TaxID=281105 RepID=A0A561UMM0_9ACTN|nr:polysaccharide deacetylase family protein [Kitasatospora viridis]TWG00574.1 peptidoglycan/xylan/chitin deacetylase (PgdA/CDA1 family) [Kitasatospora viridis]